MYKSALLILLGLLTLAATENIQITPKHYAQSIVNKSNFMSPYKFLKAILHPSLKSEVTWGTCESDGGFKVDLSNTYSEPAEPKKGKNVSLDLSGTFTQ